MNKKIKYFFLVVFFAFLSFGLVYYLFFTSDKTLETPNKTELNLNDQKHEEVAKVDNFQIPILMYHYIRDASNEDDLGKGLSVHPENFGAQIKWLKDNNYESVKLADLADEKLQAISKAYLAKKKPIVITFDDGYLDAYTQAFPELKKHDFTGTFFIIRNSVGKDDSFYLNEAQISEMTNAGMEIGSHTLTHPDLTKISLNDAKAQIEESKQNAEVFCYPAGRFNDEVANLVKESGYKAAVTTNFGYASEESDLFILRRVRIEDTNLQAFADKISAALESKY
jgi:peptidoglycan/xylan/chitin deacetylase (PgdA/CDA1 family)